MMREQDKRKRAGFTLIEVMMVVVILGILAAVVMPKIAGSGDKARRAATRASIKGIVVGVNMYRMEVGRLPQNLKALIENDGASSWDGPYLEGGVPQDAWGLEFSYTPNSDGKSFTIKSAGPDNQMGTGDDLTNQGSKGS
jgi:general secretion pathway protein G